MPTYRDQYKTQFAQTFNRKHFELFPQGLSDFSPDALCDLFNDLKSLVMNEEMTESFSGGKMKAMLTSCVSQAAQFKVKQIGIILNAYCVLKTSVNILNRYDDFKYDDWDKLLAPLQTSDMTPQDMADILRSLRIISQLQPNQQLFSSTWLNTWIDLIVTNNWTSTQMKHDLNALVVQNAIIGELAIERLDTQSFRQSELDNDVNEFMQSMESDHVKNTSASLNPREYRIPKRKGSVLEEGADDLSPLKKPTTKETRAEDANAFYPKKQTTKEMRLNKIQHAFKNKDVDSLEQLLVSISLLPREHSPRLTNQSSKITTSPVKTFFSPVQITRKPVKKNNLNVDEYYDLLQSFFTQMTTTTSITNFISMIKTIDNDFVELLLKPLSSQPHYFYELIKEKKLDLILNHLPLIFLKPLIKVFVTPLRLNITVNELIYVIHKLDDRIKLNPHETPIIHTLQEFLYQRGMDFLSQKNNGLFDNKSLRKLSDFNSRRSIDDAFHMVQNIHPKI